MSPVLMAPIRLMDALPHSCLPLEEGEQFFPVSSELS